MTETDPPDLADRSSPPPLPHPAAAAISDSGIHRRKSVLVADDLVEAAMLLASTLSERFSVVTTGSARETLSAMDAVVFDCAILDLGFPDMSTEEFIRGIEGLQKRPKNVLILTGYEAADVVPLLGGVAPRLVLQKPILAKQVMEVVEGLFIGARS